MAEYPEAIEEPKPEKAEESKPSKKAKKLAREWETWNPHGAPVSPEFVQAALDQGLEPRQIVNILEAQALGGPQTSAKWSSPELLDYFTQNPTEIPTLLQAVHSTRDAPASYAAYLEGGGEVGGYRSQGQLLQEAVLGIGGARDAYLAGTSRAQFIAAGGDPRRWITDRESFLAGEWEAPAQPAETPGLAAMADTLNGMRDDELTGLGDTLSRLMQTRAARARAQEFYGPVFDLGEEVE